MGYALRRKDRDLGATLQRVASEELSGALAQMEAGAPDATGVHDVRKHIKKLRALLRLFHAGTGTRLRAEIGALREVAQSLSSLRDAEVMLALHDRLAQGTSSSPLRAILAARVDAARADPALPSRIATARTRLSDMAGRVPGWRLKGKDGALLQAGLTRTLTRAAVAMQRARDTGGADVEAFHDWRKRTKDLWYQTRLLSPVWPEGISLWLSAADDLGELLGEHHDLVVFVELMESLGDTAAEDSLALRAQARRLLAEVEARAFALGARLYAGDPQDAVRLWMAWWRQWRAEG